MVFFVVCSFLYILNFFHTQDESEKHDEAIPFQTTSTFVFTDVEPSDEGEYGCLAVNEYGSDQVWVTTLPKAALSNNIFTFVADETDHSRKFERHCLNITEVNFSGQLVFLFVKHLTFSTNSVKFYKNFCIRKNTNS